MDQPSFQTKRGLSDNHHSTTTKRRHPPPPSIKPSTGETLFRLLCPNSKTGGLIGKGGSIIRQFREQTNAKIRIDDTIPGSDERVIFIVAADSNPNADADADDNDGGESDEVSPAQSALVKVFEKIMKVEEEGDGTVVCRLLAGGNQIGCVLGRGGKIIEKIRVESGAQVRVMPKEQVPECANPGDELIQMAGKYSAVRKALLSVSSCLQEAGNSGSNNRPLGMVPHGYGPGPGPDHRIGMEEEVVFRLLCQADKVGSLIGKGGSYKRALQTETGASVKIADPTPESDERVVSLEQRHSPAQDAVMRVLGRMAEVGVEPGAPIIARLLVHSRQIGCLWGKGGMIIAEMRRVTGASIHIFPREHVAKYGMPSDEVVQVIGSLQCVQDALFQITGRLRETLFPVRPYPPNVEMPPPRPPFMHGADHRPSYFDRPSYPYGSERPLPGRWTQSGSNRHLGEFSEFEGGSSNVNDPARRNETPVKVEVAVPQNLLGYALGENNSNLAQIKELSGANVALSEDGRVELTGTADETHKAQLLLHGFILAEQHLK
ncbi:KH domain-containing protein HEN4 isoform X1 [Tanacetum coccineum]